MYGSIARQRVRQKKNHERVNMTNAHTIDDFFLLWYSSFVLLSLGRTFCDDRAYIHSLLYHEEIELETDVTSVSTNGM
jgi:hypothetical protein